MKSLVLGLALTGTLFTVRVEAQYFGQNRVQYEGLDFEVIETEHFDVHYTADANDASMRAALMAERAYARLSRLFMHEYRLTMPIILYSSHSQFQQNNIVNVGEGTGGVTDVQRQRVLLPFTENTRDFERVLIHELVHQFQFDIFSRGVPGAIQGIAAVNPPLWFMEGMAEYFAVGSDFTLTGMWMRDAALHGDLPTIEQLDTDPTIFPYRFGHSLMSYIGDRWGPEAVGELMHAVSGAGVGPGIVRVTGLTPDELSDAWHDAVRRHYLPKLPSFQNPRDKATPITDRDDNAIYHVSPALSPDASRIAYLSDGGSFSIDLYVAPVDQSEKRSRIIRGAFSGEFESLRFIYSGGAWSPDGNWFVFAAKRGAKDDLVIVDMRRKSVANRIRVDLDGASNPSWSPEGNRIVFTGFAGGQSDLYLIDIATRQMTRLTNDIHSDLQPSWSPDGRTIVFSSDRGPDTGLDELEFGRLRLSYLDIESGVVTVPEGVGGNNLDPEWSPDGLSVAYISDRNGVANIYLTEVASQQHFQVTNLWTGVAGITEISPALSWARGADQLAFSYYNDGRYDVWRINNPRGGAVSLADSDTTVISNRVDPGVDSRNTLLSRMRFSSEALLGVRPTPRRPRNDRSVSVVELLDSAARELPDTADFGRRDYSATLHPDYIAQPTVGYVRDNFGSGVFGGAAVSFSDLMANHRLNAQAQVNGRLAEGILGASYANLSRRVIWAVGYQQYPLFYYTDASVSVTPESAFLYRTSLRRLTFKELFVEAHRPFDRFTRLELGVTGNHVGEADLTFEQTVAAGRLVDQDISTVGIGSVNYFQPKAALVFDNSIHGWIGPVAGKRSRLEYSPAIGGWSFHQVLADVRRYDRPAGPFILATRALFFGRFGEDASRFSLYLGNPDILRGFTAGSFRRSECGVDGAAVVLACDKIDQLIGTRLISGSAELRLPIASPRPGGGAFGLGVPPIEAALFVDAGVTWDTGSRLAWKRDPGDSPRDVRIPLVSWGGSLRANLYNVVILRFDLAKPLNRRAQGAYVTLSIGPAF